MGQDVLDALIENRETCGGIRIPSYLRHAFELISADASGLPDYISQALIHPAQDGNMGVSEFVLSTFERIWFSLLQPRRADKISVLEPACGSANDYRRLHSFGVAPFLEYVGFDICDENIANARRRFPGVAFETGDVLAISAEDKSCDFLFVHDLSEHLSEAALEAALIEVSRVTRRQACLSFFNMTDAPGHIIRPDGLYHWNTLSLAQIQRSLMKQARDIQVVYIGTFLKDSYGCTDHHNRGAYTLVVSFEE